MKKAIREWAFNLFTKRITIKVAGLPNDAKIEFLANKLMNELVAQGHDIGSTNKDAEFFNVFGFSNGEVHLDSHKVKLRFKRLPKA